MTPILDGMEGNMLAFMSGTVGPVEQAHWRNLGNGSVPQWELQRQAMREAERVLAEAEAETLSAHVRIGGSAIRCSHSVAVPVGLNVVLAESLAAVLPVLDEMAHETAMAESDDWLMLVNIYDRNCATLAGMEAR